MIEGKFIGDSAFIKIVIASGDAVQERFFIIDTGFSGYLQVSENIAKELNLETKGVMTVRLANGSAENARVSTIEAFVEKKHTPVDVLILNTQPLLGIKFLKKFECVLNLDCKNEKVSIT